MRFLRFLCYFLFISLLLHQMSILTTGVQINLVIHHVFEHMFLIYCSTDINSDLAHTGYSLFWYNFESQLSEILIFLKHYHGNRKNGFIIKMELNSCRWISQEIALVLHKQSLSK